MLAPAAAAPGHGPSAGREADNPSRSFTYAPSHDPPSRGKLSPSVGQQDANTRGC
jgi:hypothetical protein